jgi:hypothetical protein
VLTISTTMAQDDTVSHDTKELRLFDPSIFGKQPSDPLALLLPGKNLVHPLRVKVDFKEGCYAAATVTYDKVDFEEARRSLNKRYKKYEVTQYVDNKQLALWRNTKDKYAIQLASFGDQGLIQVIYISFEIAPK